MNGEKKEPGGERNSICKQKVQAPIRANRQGGLQEDSEGGVIRPGASPFLL